MNVPEEPVSIPAADDLEYARLLADFPLPEWEVTRAGPLIAAGRACSARIFRDTSPGVIRAALGLVHDEEQVADAKSWPY